MPAIFDRRGFAAGTSMSRLLLLARARLRSAGFLTGAVWNVSDPATLVLMHYFTKKLGEGAAPEFAMQYAQLKTMTYRNRKSGDQPFLDDPKMWASFSIYGKPSRDPAR